MIEAKACCKECDYVFAEKGAQDDGAYIERVSEVAQAHADDQKHEVEFRRHEHAPRIINPRAFPPGPGQRFNIHAVNPLNDSYV